MEYFVVADDGNRYGPANIATLNSWIAEGRLLPQTTLENAATGVQSKANMTAGLVFATTPPTFSSAPPASRPATLYASAPPQRTASSGKDHKNALSSIGLGAAAIVCVFFIGIGGLILGVPAVRFGYTAVSDDENYIGIIGIVLGVIAMILWVIARLHIGR